MVTHSSILAWRSPCTEEPGGATAHGVTKSQTGLTTRRTVCSLDTTRRLGPAATPTCSRNFCHIANAACHLHTKLNQSPPPVVSKIKQKQSDHSRV